MEKGYVVCLLKYILGNGDSDSRNWDILSENNRPVSLGYFGRVDAVHVDQFKDYMAIASTHNAGFTGSRKQLLLYPLNLPHPEQIKFQEFDAKDAGRLPFQPVSGSRPCFCCLSILNISQSVKEHECNGDYASGIRRIAAVMAQQIDGFVEESGGDAWLPYGIMGLLGTEDICVIFLSDSFDIVCAAINRLRRLETKDSHQRILDNSHSILMVDFSEDSVPPQWGDTMAEIHFSLKSGKGLDYIMGVREAIASHAPDQDVVLNNQIGEYDAVIRCPASALGGYLYQMLNYGTTKYRDAAYQSETLLFQRTGISTVSPIPVDLSSSAGEPPQPGETLANELAGPMKDLVKKICECLEDEAAAPGAREESGSSYVSQVLYRLLKDFMRNVSIPVGGTFQHDLSIQFQVAINAILHIAQTYRKDRTSSSQAQQNFDMNFSQIVEAMSKSMQAASQIDRLCFEEQQSHLQNTGTYHKVLLAYYGIVKAILELIYTIPRKGNCRQAVLIPLLSFGHTQIICSNAINSSFQEEGSDKSVPARLICITLPYQALSNIPKYIGPLVHEIFHYSAPSDRESRNGDAGKCLTAVAFRCFLDQAAASAHLPDQLGVLIFSRYREEFQNTADAMFENIWESLMDDYRALAKANPAEDASDEDSIASDAFFRAIRRALIPCGMADTITVTEKLYCEGWKDLRKQFLKRDDLGDAITSAFRLTEELDEDAMQAYVIGIWERHAGQIAEKISALLSVYETYLREIPPDLFDIGCVTLGVPQEVKAQQYLWQVHSIRKDKFYYSDGRHTGDASCWIDGNSIRIGAVLDHLVFDSLADSEWSGSSSMRKKYILQKLQEWYSAEGECTQDMAKCKSAISMDYEKYCTESIFANLLIGDYIKQIDQQIHELIQSCQAQKIMKRLTKFYQEYYEALNELDSERQADITFDLAIRIIEFYQDQKKLSTLCRLCGSAPVLADDKAKGAAARSLLLYTAYECETMVFDPSGLSGAITQVFEAMCPKATEAPLWFRGQAESDWKLLPNAMRPIKLPDGTSNIGEDGILPGMRKMLTLAKAKILPQGDRFHKAEWLALLQHYKFKTTLLDWSEDLHSALYFAIEPWIEHPDEKQSKNASVRVLNPILYNLARDLLEKEREKALGPQKKSAYVQSVERLRNYLETGCDKGEEYAIPLFTHGCNDEYQCYFDLDIDREIDEKHINLPMAAMTPATNERMKTQAGVFTFCDVRSKPKLADGSWSYNANELSEIQQRFFQSVNQLDIPRRFIRPFLYNIVLNCKNAKAFAHYLRAIGIRKYRMYPELTSLADDIMAQSF